MFFLFRAVPVSSIGFLQHHSEMFILFSDVPLLLNGQHVLIRNKRGISKEGQTIIFHI